MSATTPRTISNAPDLRQLLAAVGALILAVALLVAVTLSRQASFQAAAPAAQPATVTFDHGWSTSAVQRVISPTVNGSTGFVVTAPKGAILSTGIPYPARPTWNGELVTPTKGGILYVGIPYPAPGGSQTSSNGLVVATQNGGILYTGIPYPAPATDVPGGSRMQTAQ